MANPSHLNIVRQGAKVIEEWRKKNQDVILDLHSAELFSSPNEKIDLSNADLSHADLSHANFSESNLINADLTESNLTQANFSKANLTSADLKRTKLNHTIFEGADLTNANLHGADFSNGRLGGAILNDVDLTESQAANAYLVDSELKRARFARANIRETNFGGCNFTKANFTDTELNRSDLSNAILKDAYLHNTKLHGTNFDRADLTNANVIGADLTDTSLSGANLLGLQINSTTKMDTVRDVTGCKIDRYALEYLSSQKNNLTSGKMMDMNIHDDFAVLRSQFGGLWGTIHFISILLFLAPYAWFMLSIRPIAEFNLSSISVSAEVAKGLDFLNVPSDAASQDTIKTITLFEALVRYLWSGGVDWEGECKFNKMSFLAFYFFLTYNALRAMLLWMTKKLETEETVTKLPVRFLLNQPLFAFKEKPAPVNFKLIRNCYRYLTQNFISEIEWNDCLTLVNKGVWVYLFFVLYNTFHFLSMEIPIKY